MAGYSGPESGWVPDEDWRVPTFEYEYHPNRFAPSPPEVEPADVLVAQYLLAGALEF